jgi:magnesium-transporting ATPase (P-type)
LSPIYGAVLESRRIFMRIKAYVVYRVAASIILVLTLSTIIFATGCAVDSLLIIILALMNDISMIPVAYDNASATTKPQLPNARKLVMMSLYYGIFQAAAGLVFIFALDHDSEIDLNSECKSDTRGFIWMHLVLVTELAIFSVRAPSYFWFSVPSMYLVASVALTCFGCSFIAVYTSQLSGANLGWIWLYNVGIFIVVDVGKVWFRNLIDDNPGDVIESNELVEVDEAKTELVKKIEKKKRYRVHSESVLEMADMQHTVEVRDRNRFFDSFRELGPITDGFVHNQHRRDVALVGVGTSRRKAVSSPNLNFGG